MTTLKEHLDRIDWHIREIREGWEELSDLPNRPDFEKGARVYVRKNYNQPWKRAHFAHWPLDNQEDRGIWVIKHGKSPWTTNTEAACYYQEWKGQIEL